MHEAVPRARAEPLLTGVARGTRRGETVQVQAPAAVLDLDAAVRRGDENPFFQRRRVVGLRAVYALGELKARVEATPRCMIRYLLTVVPCIADALAGREKLAATPAAAMTVMTACSSPRLRMATSLASADGRRQAA